MNRWISFLCAVLFGVAGGARPAFAGDSRAAKEPPSFSSETSIVAVPVFVTDKAGKALPALSPEDFEVLQDGKKARIVSFQYIDTTSEEAQEEIRAAPAARRHFMLLFDLSFTNPAGIHRAQQSATAFVRRRIAASDLVAVAAFDVTRGMRLVANFTDDKGLLVHAIATLGAPSFTRIVDPLALVASIGAQEIAFGASRRSGDDVNIQAELFHAAIAQRIRTSEDQLYRAQVQTLLESFDDLGRSLRRVEGRKQIVYFSAGFDSQALVGSASTSDMLEASEASIEGRLWEVDSAARFGDTRLRGLVETMIGSLSRSDVVVHSIDVTGLGGERGIADNTIARDPTRDTRGQEFLNQVAAGTGGRLFKDANNLDPVLGELLDMTSRYYILGYQPESAEPGSFHKLKVKVRRAGAHVSHRAGYFESGPLPGKASLQRKFEAAQLVMTGGGSGKLRFSALCLPFPAPGDRQTVGVVLQIPKEELRWDRRINVEVYGYAIGEDGAVADHLAQLAGVEPSASEAGRNARGLAFIGTLKVPPGKYILKLSVQDPETSAGGYQFIDVTVPPRDGRQGFLLPPVLLDDPSQWIAVAMTSGHAKPEDSPLAFGGRTFLPRTTFRVVPGAPDQLLLMAYEPDQLVDPAAAIQIRSSLTDATGNAVPAGSFRVDHIQRDENGRRAYVLAYTPRDLAPGDYTLRIGIGESGSRMESYSLVRVTGDKPANP